ERIASSLSSVPRFAGEAVDGDADLADGALPLVVEVGIEEQPLVGRHAEPAIGLDLVVELPWTPAGIAQRQQALPRAAAAGDVAQDIEAGGQCDIAADGHGAVVMVVGRMQHEAAAGLHRAPEMDADVAPEGRPLDPELGQEVR